MGSFCKCKSYSHFFSKNISIYAIFNDQGFNNTLTNDIVSFEQLGRVVSASDHEVPGKNPTESGIQFVTDCTVLHCREPFVSTPRHLNIIKIMLKGTKNTKWSSSIC